jgi:hypothetical protein
MNAVSKASAVVGDTPQSTASCYFVPAADSFVLPTRGVGRCPSGPDMLGCQMVSHTPWHIMFCLAVCPHPVLPRSTKPLIASLVLIASLTHPSLPLLPPPPPGPAVPCAGPCVPVHPQHLAGRPSGGALRRQPACAEAGPAAAGPPQGSNMGRGHGIRPVCHGQEGSRAQEQGRGGNGNCTDQGGDKGPWGVGAGGKALCTDRLTAADLGRWTHVCVDICCCVCASMCVPWLACACMLVCRALLLAVAPSSMLLHVAALIVGPRVC